MLIINIFISKPGLYSNVNAIYNSAMFEGEAMLKAKPLKISNDKRFLKVYIEVDNETYEFEGNTNEMAQLIDNKVEITVYQGIFTKYALIEK